MTFISCWGGGVDSGLIGLYLKSEPLGEECLGSGGGEQPGDQDKVTKVYHGVVQNKEYPVYASRTHVKASRS